MASNYPGSLDSFDTIASDKKTSDSVGGRTHRQMHNDLGDAVEAVQTELGTNPSGSDATVAARLSAIEAGTNLATGAVTAAKIADDTITAAQIAANAVGASELADNAVDTNAIANDAVTNVKLGSDVRIGNLLTANQASIETDTTGFGLWGGASYSRSTAQAAHGSASLLVTYDAAGSGDICTKRAAASDMVPVTAGEVITVSAMMRQNVGTRRGRLWASFFNESNTLVAYGDTATITLGTTFQTVSKTYTVPAGATRMCLIVGTPDSGSASDSMFVDCLGLWRGSGGQWAMPGQPIVGQSHIATNGAVHLSGTGSPEGVVTAAPGSTWLQTDATTDVKGWIRWVKATGTGNTGWQAGAEADTGNRNLNAESWSNSWASYGSTGQRLRRVGGTVQLQLDVSKASASADAIYTLPSGFRPVSPVYVQCQTGTADDVAAVNIATNGAVTIVRSTATSNVIYGQAVFITADSWPTALPGSAA